MQYTIRITFDGVYETTVDADDESEAQSKAMKELREVPGLEVDNPRPV